MPFCVYRNEHWSQSILRKKREPVKYEASFGNLAVKGPTLERRRRMAADK